MVRSVTVFDEDWTEEDMAAALDWQTEQANRCPGCGLPTDETTDPERDGLYVAELVTCHACAAGDKEQRNYQKEDGDMAGVRRRVRELD